MNFRLYIYNKRKYDEAIRQALLLTIWHAANQICSKRLVPFIPELFNDWLEQFLLKELKPGQFVVMDNAAFHKSKKTKELIESVGCKIIFLPPYSPDLNPIEKFGANMKRWIKNKIV